MTVDENIVNRLIFVRILFDNAVDQSHKKEPFNLTTILSLHDSVEFLLKIFADYKNIDMNNISFLKHWERFKDIGIEIPELNSMTRLNEARKSIKHYANLPSSTDIGDFITKTKSVISFILRSMELDFDLLDLEIIIRNKSFKEQISLIKQLIEGNDYKGAIKKIAEYLYYLFYEFDYVFSNYNYKTYDWLDSTNMEKSDTFNFKNKIPTVTMYGNGPMVIFDYNWPDYIGVPFGKCPSEESIATLELAEFGLKYIIKLTILLEKDYTNSK